MKYKLFIITFFLPLFMMAQTKNGTIIGSVVENGTDKPLQSALLQLFSLPDTTFTAGVASDYEGNFSITAPAAKYLMRISFIGYVTQEKSVVVEKGKKTECGTIKLLTDDFMLENAIVTAEVPPVTASEDTLVFNTAAFRVPQGSMLEELIKKYPGVQIEDDGTIKINGKTVNRILMKGKDFFGTDKDVALKNISVDAVDKVKFYDKKSDFTRMTGIDDGEEETVLDLQMKKGVDDGFFSNSEAGYGTHNRYRLRNTTSYYNDDAQYTLVLSANNLGDQGFSDGRARGFGGGPSAGLSAPKLAGFNFAYENDKVELGGNVRGNHNRTDLQNWVSSETFLPQLGRNQFTNSRNNNQGRSTRVNGDFRLEWKADSLTNVIFRPSVNYSNTGSWAESHSSTFNENPFDFVEDYSKESYGDVVDKLDSIAINSNFNKSLGLGSNLSLNARLQVNRKFSKKGRNLTFRANGSFAESKSNNYSNNNVTFYQATTVPNSAQKRYSTTPGTNWGYNVGVSYTEPLLKNFFLQLNYAFDYSYNNNDRSTYKFDELIDYIMDISPDFTRPNLPADGNIITFLDDSLSRYSTYRTQKHEAGIMFRLVTSKMNFNFGATYIPQQTQLDYKYQGRDTVFVRRVHNVSPNIRFRYKWSKQTTLNIRYRGSTAMPSMTDLIDIEDDSNPLYITKGNPGLKPSFSNNVNAFFNTYNTDAQRGINIYAGFNNTLNAIVRKATYVEETGATISQPENINGNWNVNGGFSFNSAIPANTKFTYSTHTDARYSNNVSYISVRNVAGSVRSIARTVNVSERLMASYRTNNFDVSLSGFFRYSHSKSTAQPEDKMNVFDFSYGPSVNYTLPWYNIQLSTNISMSSRRGYSDPNANTDELLWNAQVSASFLPKNALGVSFQVFDILQQQSNISRIVDALYRRDTESNAIYSYCMLNVSYRFNNTGDDTSKLKGKAAREYNHRQSDRPLPGMMPPGPPPGGGGAPRF